MNKADNLQMSAEEWYKSEIEQGYCFIDMFDFAYLYSDYLLSHHINVLAERKYSEEEVRNMFKLYQNFFSLHRNIQVLDSEFNEWFEQFKK